MSFSNKQKVGYKTDALVFFRALGFNADYTGMRQGKVPGTAASPAKQACKQLLAQGLNSWVQALQTLAVDRLFAPEHPVHYISATGLILPQQKAWWNKCSQSKGKLRQSRKFSLGYQALFLPVSSALFPVLWIIGLCLLQPAPCRPHQGLQSNHEGSAEVRYRTTETGFITLKAPLQHSIALWCYKKAFL